MNIPTDDKAVVKATLCYFLRGKPDTEEVMLAVKLKKIGTGCRNGYGGGVDPGENALQSMIRELSEETTDGTTKGVTVEAKDLKHVATARFHNTNEEGTSYICKVYIFITRKWKGEFLPSLEMGDPKWFPFSSLPLDNLMLADQQWLPQVLAQNSGSKHQLYKIIAAYGPNQKKLLGPVIVIPVDSLSLD